MKFIPLFILSFLLSFSSCQANKKPTPQANKVVPTKKETGVKMLTLNEFKQKIMDYEANPDTWIYKGENPAIIDFYATWCGPCKMVAPIMESLAKQYDGKIDFYKIDVDKEQELASMFGIQSIPALLIIPKEGKPSMQVGAMSREQLENIIKSQLLK